MNSFLFGLRSTSLAKIIKKKKDKKKPRYSWGADMLFGFCTHHITVCNTGFGWSTLQCHTAKASKLDCCPSVIEPDIIWSKSTSLPFEYLEGVNFFMAKGRNWNAPYIFSCSLVISLLSIIKMQTLPTMVMSNDLIVKSASSVSSTHSTVIGPYWMVSLLSGQYLWHLI